MDERIYARYMSDIAYFHTLLESQPDSIYFIPIALSYNKLEKYDESIEICRAGLLKFPGNCTVMTLLAEAYLYKGSFELAKELLFEVVTADDANYKALKLLGIISRSQDEPDAALKYFKAAFYRAPEDEELKKTIEDMGGSVNPDDIANEKRSQQQNELDPEDEEAKTFMEIDMKIKNAEMMMADLVSDTSIMSAKRSKDTDVDSAIMDLDAESAVDNNFISDNELENLLANAVEPVIDEPQDDIAIAPPESVLIDDDLAKLMRQQLGHDDSSDTEEDLISALAGDDDSIDDDLLAALAQDDENPEEDIAGDLLSALSADEPPIDIYEKLLNEEAQPATRIEGGEDFFEFTENIRIGKPIDISMIDEIAEPPTPPTKEIEEALGQVEDIKIEKPFDTAFTLEDMISDDDFDFEDMSEMESDEDESLSEGTYVEKVAEPSLGESAPFVQSDIMDEIWGAAGMLKDDEAQDSIDDDKKRQIDKLEKLEQKLKRINKKAVS